MPHCSLACILEGDTHFRDLFFGNRPLACACLVLEDKARREMIRVPVSGPSGREVLVALHEAMRPFPVGRQASLCRQGGRMLDAPYEYACSRACYAWYYYPCQLRSKNETAACGSLFIAQYRTLDTGSGR